MFYNLKLAFRNLRRNAFYTWLNIAGLTIGIVATVLILIWVEDEWKYDSFFKNTDDIYVAISHSIENGKESYLEYNPAPLARTAKAEIPDIEDATAFGYAWNLSYLENNEKKCSGDYSHFAISDSTFFNIFDMDFVEGNASTAFSDPQAIILTEDWAQLLFGNEEAVGKTIKANTGDNYHVTAVIKKPKQNSFLQFKAMISFEQSSRKDNWRQSANLCYLKIRPGSDIKKIGKQLAEAHERKAQGYTADYPYILQPLSQSHLYAPDGSETGMKNVRLFSIIAIALLTIACINYVNLITSRIHKRAKEIGIKRVLGANKLTLFLQTMRESVLLFFISLVISQFMIFILMPIYSEITGKQFDFNFFSPNLWILYLCIFIFIIVVAGIYPALQVAARNTKSKTSIPLRKILVILQFSSSAALILATIIMNSQQHFMTNKNLGYKKENVFTIDLLGNNNSIHYQHALIQELEKQPEIIGVTGSEQNVLNNGNFTSIEWEGKPENLTFSTAYTGIDRNFLQLLDIPLVDGKGFTGTQSDSMSFLVNETAVKQMGLENPLNTWINISWLGRGNMRIAGVVKDFHFRHMKEEIGPMLMFLTKKYWTLYIKAAPGKTKEAIAVTERIWKNFERDHPFEYKFMDETFANMYKADTQANSLFNAFAFIAILISCLGLFGLVTYTAETKTKEIGIRKVLGASVKNIVSLLTKEFMILIGVALIIALPLTYFWMNSMLEDYAYRISIEWWMFLIAGIITIALTLLTMGWQAVKSATANPVNSIKSE